ncbi:hypothetical protein EB796_003089 [Bugula neritina]|uniref:Uncharacterized protein n=1 Tax=Bugula neritina TaxID=10212 RepID=A0A7J7KJ18_BUGNE|nr:hypothetical protein EB796_003089 [Bugula neritina]
MLLTVSSLNVLGDGVIIRSVYLPLQRCNAKLCDFAACAVKQRRQLKSHASIIQFYLVLISVWPLVYFYKLNF